VGHGVGRPKDRENLQCAQWRWAAKDPVKWLVMCTKGLAGLWRVLNDDKNFASKKSWADRCGQRDIPLPPTPSRRIGARWLASLVD
jgi:hypothetical protein